MTREQAEADEMNVPRKIHVDFEVALELAYPRLPIPSLDGLELIGYAQHPMRELFTGKSWPEVFGVRLIYEIDLSLSIWLDGLPPKIFDYFVPSHLMLASLCAGGKRRWNYVESVMECFLLPPLPESPEAIAEIDAELFPDAQVSSRGSERLAFYRRITPEQRACIGRFLDIYLSYRGEQFATRGVQLFEQNRDYWLNSSH